MKIKRRVENKSRIESESCWLHWNWANKYFYKDVVKNAMKKIMYVNVACIL